MGSYFLPGVGVPNNDDRVIGFQNNRTNRFAVRRTNIFIHRKIRDSVSALMFTPI